jgi:hypothetical protein
MPDVDFIKGEKRQLSYIYHHMVYIPDISLKVTNHFILKLCLRYQQGIHRDLAGFEVIVLEQL